MTSNRHQRIDAKAHAIWEAEGRPEGRALDHWLQAEREITGEEQLDEGLRESFPGSDAPTATRRESH